MDMPGATVECGKTLWQTVPVAGNPLPAEVDFPWSHEGVCAAYCDDKQFFKGNNCKIEHPGPIKVDQAKCAGARWLQVMDVAAHVEQFQYHVNCVPIESGPGCVATAGGGAGSTRLLHA